MVAASSTSSSWSAPPSTLIAGVSHVMWTGRPGEGARWPQRRLLWRAGDPPQPLRHRHLGPDGPARRPRPARPGDSFVHESVIGGRFTGRIEGLPTVGPYPAILPSIEGWARVTGLNTILVDDRDPFAYGLQLS